MGGSWADLPLLQSGEQVVGIAAQCVSHDLAHITDARSLTRPGGELGPAIRHGGDRTVALHPLAQGIQPGIPHVAAAEAKISRVRVGSITSRHIKILF